MSVFGVSENAPPTFRDWLHGAAPATRGAAPAPAGAPAERTGRRVDASAEATAFGSSHPVAFMAHGREVSFRAEGR